MERRSQPLFLLLTSLLIVASLSFYPAEAQTPDPSDTSDRAAEADTTVKGAPFVPSPQHVVWRMLDLADVSEDDVVVDLGSGDGRIVLAAAQRYGARGIGVEIDPDLVEKARTKARHLDLTDRVTFRQGDLFEADLSEATVVMLYLWPDMNNRLRSKLQSELDPGDRVVSHSFDIDGWKADTTVTINPEAPTEGIKTLFRWTIPDSAGSR